MHGRSQRRESGSEVFADAHSLVRRLGLAICMAVSVVASHGGEQKRIAAKLANHCDI